jgi:hypothetical protein
VRDQDGHLIGDSPEIYVRLDDPNFFSTDHLGLFLRVEVKVDIFGATALGPKSIIPVARGPCFHRIAVAPHLHVRGTILSSESITLGRTDANEPTPMNRRQ